MASEHTCSTYLFVNNFIKMVNFFEMFASWMRIPDAWIPNNQEITVCGDF
jgi:hypothetical protein